jgi:putative copper resistance protein D
VIDAIVWDARLTQYLAAMLLFGAPMFLLYALGATTRSASAGLGWARALIGSGAFVLLLASLTSLLGQTALMAGDPKLAFDREALEIVLRDTAFGAAILSRLVLAVFAGLCALTLKPSPRLWLIAVGTGGLVLASFAWTGHGAVEEGLAGVIHAASDVVHLIAAGAWLGALAVFSLLLWPRDRPPSREATAVLHQALKRFSGVGSLLVATILASGLVNSWFLVGPSHLQGLLTTPYGQLLLGKLALFAAMLALAASNRFRLTPALGRALDEPHALQGAHGRLRRSLFLETGLAALILALVSILGMIAPITAQM